MEHDLKLTQYTEKSYLVRGDTKSHKDELKKLGGKYIATPKDGKGPGWMFSRLKLEALERELGLVVEEASKVYVSLHSDRRFEIKSPGVLIEDSEEFSFHYIPSLQAYAVKLGDQLELLEEEK